MNGTFVIDIADDIGELTHWFQSRMSESSGISIVILAPLGPYSVRVAGGNWLATDVFDDDFTDFPLIPSPSPPEYRGRRGQELTLQATIVLPKKRFVPCREPMVFAHRNDLLSGCEGSKLGSSTCSR